MKSFMFSVDYIEPIVKVVVCNIYRGEGQVKLLLDFPIPGIQLIDAIGILCGSPNMGFIGGKPIPKYISFHHIQSVVKTNIDRILLERHFAV